MIFFLLKNKILSMRNELRPGANRKAHKRILGYLALAVFPVWLFTMTLRLFSGWLLLSDTSTIILIKFTSLTLSGIFFFLLVSGISVGLHKLFLSKDLPLLLTLPIARRTIFLYKFIETVFANSTIFFILGLPIVLALGVATHASLLYYLVAVILSLFFISIPTGVSTVLTMVLLRILPVKSAKNLSTILIALISLGAWAGFQFVRFSQLNVHSSQFDPTSLQQFSQTGIPVFLTLLPSHWLATSLYGVSQGVYGAGLLDMLSVVSLALLFYLLSINVLELSFDYDLLGTASTLKFAMGAKNSVHTSTRTRFTFLEQVPLWAALQRDLKLVFRDSRQITQLFLYGTFMLIFPILMRNDNNLADVVLARYFPFSFIFILGATVTCSLAARLIPMESLSFQYSKIVPQSMKTFLMAKFIIAYVITSLMYIVTCTLLSFFLKTTLVTYLSSILISLLISFGAGGLGLYLGARFAKFDWDNPKRMLEGFGTVLITFGPAVYALIGIFILLAGFFVMSPLLSLIALAFYSLLLFIIGTVLARKRLDKLEWAF